MRNPGGGRYSRLAKRLGLTIPDLACVAVVIQAYRSGRITAAAEVFSISQPQASRRIQEVERVVGFKILVRYGDGLGLVATPQGVLWIEQMESVMGRLSAVLEEIKERHGGMVKSPEMVRVAA